MREVVRVQAEGFADARDNVNTVKSDREHLQREVDRVVGSRKE